MRRAAFAVVTVAMYLLISPSAFAVENDAFGVVPQPANVKGVNRSGFQIPLETGAAFDDAVRVYNRTDQPVDLALYSSDADVKPGGAVSISARGAQAKGVGSWITLSRSKVSLPPKGETVVDFRVTVRSADPAPANGAIVVENTARGLAARLADRLDLLVRTAPANSPTTSKRVRPALLRSPWSLVALLGLIVAIAAIWIGWRRARRTKDMVVPPGEVERADREVPAASVPVIRRLGTAPDEEEGPLLDDDLLVEVDEPDDEEEEGELEEDEPAFEADEELPPARTRTRTAVKPAAPRPQPKSGPARKKPAAKERVARKKTPIPKKKPSSPKPKVSSTRSERNYIPLDEL